MFREIKKKQIILENRKPYNKDATEYIMELNYVDWVYSSMRLDGSPLSRSSVERMLKGDFVENATLDEHGMIGRYYSAIKRAYGMLDMGTGLNLKTIFEIYGILSGVTAPQYRRSNPVLVTLNYNPPHPRSIEEQMDILMQWLHGGDFETNMLLKAAYLHNKFIEIYPFEEYCEAMARFVMYYFAMQNGFPPFALGFSEQEYNKAVSKYLKKEEIEPFYNAVERAVFNKMEVMMQLTAPE